MIGFITNTIDNPWTGSDVYEFEKNGSQRDPIQYNSYYNWRIKLTDKNMYLCSLKTNNGDYKNIYLFAVRRNLFYFAIFIPQLEILKQFKGNQQIARALQSLPLTQQCLNSENKEINLGQEVLSLDGSCLLVKVNAPIDVFLYPRDKQISNPEIKQKYAFLNNLYFQIEKEYDGLLKIIGEYDAKAKLKIEDIKNRLQRILVRKGVRMGVSLALAGITGGLSVGLDTLFGLDDVADINDLLDIADISDVMGDAMDAVDVADILDPDILDFDIEDMDDNNIVDAGAEDLTSCSFSDDEPSGHEISFTGHEFYDTEINRANNNLENHAEDLLQARTSAEAQRDLDRIRMDRRSIDYWEGCKRNALIESEKNDIFIDGINAKLEIIERYRNKHK